MSGNEFEKLRAEAEFKGYPGSDPSRIDGLNWAPFNRLLEKMTTLPRLERVK